MAGVLDTAPGYRTAGPCTGAPRRGSPCNTLNAIWYGPWLVPLGYLIIKSRYFPKALGVLPIVGCAGYLGWLLTTFLAPDAPEGIGSALLAVAAIGEGSFVVWLVVKGVRLPAAPAASLSGRL